MENQFANHLLVSRKQLHTRQGECKQSRMGVNQTCASNIYRIVMSCLSLIQRQNKFTPQKPQNHLTKSVQVQRAKFQESTKNQKNRNIESRLA